ncbi:MAG: hypothetical protein ACREAM_28415, partial [Blastocatellia bacterium]
CYQAVERQGWATSLFSYDASGAVGGAGAVSIAAVLFGGLIFGLKHALDADHLAAVSTIVSERKSLLSSTLIGGLWGIGHTISLLAAGVVVILLRVRISEKLGMAFEFCVALMLIGLGAGALYKLARGGRLHWHEHEHGGHKHFHPHIHDKVSEPHPRTHHGLGFSVRPLLIGMVHGMAGSAALMLAVLAEIRQPGVQLAYIAVFGIGSIGGMMAMSSLLALPARLTTEKFAWTHMAIRALAGCFSLGFGLFMAYEIGFVDGLLR